MSISKKNNLITPRIGKNTFIEVSCWVEVEDFECESNPSTKDLHYIFINSDCFVCAFPCLEKEYKGKIAINYIDHNNEMEYLVINETLEEIATRLRELDVDFIISEPEFYAPWLITTSYISSIRVCEFAQSSYMAYVTIFSYEFDTEYGNELGYSREMITFRNQIQKINKKAKGE